MARSTGRSGAGHWRRLATSGRFCWSAFASSATTRQAIGPTFCDSSLDDTNWLPPSPDLLLTKRGEGDELCP